MNTLQTNTWTQAWSALGKTLPRPGTVLVISAHWYLPGTRVTAMPQPRTIHDFGNFPDALFNVQYPSPGNPELAAHIKELLQPTVVELDQTWGLDHGAWSVLYHIYPQSGIPVIQLSLDATQPPVYHYDLAQRSSSLRDEGVLILGSGNIVHNLARYDWNDPGREPCDWARTFDQYIRRGLMNGEHDSLIYYHTPGEPARLSVPSPEHYLPLLYVIAQKRTGDTISFPVEGYDGGAISMTAVLITGAG
jgi:4,5-DOPA dioxygenase extradiol